MKRISIFILSLIIPLAASAYGKPFFHNISALEYDGHNRNFDIECDATGKVYAANFEGLIVWDGLHWEMVHTPGISRISSLMKSDDGTIWFGGYNVLGIIKEDGSLQYLATDVDDSTDFGEITDIFKENGEIHFVAEGKRYSVKDGRITASETSEAEEDAYMKWNGMDVYSKIALPDLGLSALATVSDGLIVLDSEGNELYRLTEEDGLCSNSINSLAYDGKGSLWGATSNGLFQVCLSPVFSHYGATDGLNGMVTSIAHAGGILHVGTLQGLFRLDSNGKFQKIHGLDLACWQLTVSSDGKLYAATAQGLFICGSTLKEITPRHTLAIHIESNSSIITGETDGIYRILTDGTSSKINGAKNVCKFFPDPEGGLWAINYYGETFYKAPDSNAFTERENGELTLLFEYTDPSGSSWHSNNDNQGLVGEGIPADQAVWCKMLDSYSIEAMEIHDRTAYIGGNFGLVCMDMDAMGRTEPYKPSLFIRTLHQDDKNVSYSAAMDKTDPVGAPSYSWRLHDDDGWSKWSSSGSVSFGRLQIGQYELTVRSKDSFGNIVETEPLPFKVNAPFYLKWYAIIFYLALLIGGTWGFVKVKLYKAKQAQEHLEKLVDERTSELKEAQNQLLRQEREATVGKLTKGLIDRILNPMNYINNFSHITRDLTKDLVQDIEDEKDSMDPDNYDDCLDVVEMMNTNLEKIEQHGISTTKILKAMEELLKDRTGKIEKTDLAVIGKQDYEMFLNYYKEDIEKYNIDVQWLMPSEAVTAEVNQENLSKTIMSILANSVYAVRKKFSKGGSTERPVIGVSLKKTEKGGSRIIIHDNGIGIEESILDKIFDPFFTTKPTSEAPGVGLYLSQQVIQDFGGRIDVESKKDEYTNFIIELP